MKDKSETEVSLLKKLVLVVAVFFVFSMAANAARAVYTLVDLGPGTSAVAINSNCQVAVQVAPSSGSDYRAAIWSNGNLNIFPSQNPATCWAINAFGDVAGEQVVNGIRVATVWHQGGESRIAGMATALGINSHNELVGSTEAQAAIYTRGRVYPLYPLPGGSACLARAISNTVPAVVVGDSSWSGSGHHAIVWIPDGEVDLHLKAPAKAHSSQATAISPNGRWVAGTYYFVSQIKSRQVGVTHACLWDMETGRFYDLGRDRVSSEGLGVNDSGQVVGTSGGRAAIWKGNRLSYLDNLVKLPAGFRLWVARGISNNGKICGDGTHGWVLK